MHYYNFSALVFANGQIRDAFNLTYSSEKPSTIIEFRKKIANHHAGPPDSYSAIIIPMWEEIDEQTFNHINQGFNDLQ